MIYPWESVILKSIPDRYLFLKTLGWLRGVGEENVNIFLGQCFLKLNILTQFWKIELKTVFLVQKALEKNITRKIAIFFFL